MWSLLEFFPEDFQINILDVGAALSERPPYHHWSLLAAGASSFSSLIVRHAKINRQYGKPHRFFPFFVGDGRPAIFHETNWVLTGSLYEPNSRLLEKFQNLAEFVRRSPTVTTRLRNQDWRYRFHKSKFKAVIAVFRIRALSGAFP